MIIEKKTDILIITFLKYPKNSLREVEIYDDITNLYFEYKTKNIILNMQNKEHISSYEISKLMQLRKIVNENSGTLILTNIPEKIVKILDKSGVLSIFEFCDEFNDALELLKNKG